MDEPLRRKQERALVGADAAGDHRSHDRIV